MDRMDLERVAAAAQAIRGRSVAELRRAFSVKAGGNNHVRAIKSALLGSDDGALVRRLYDENSLKVTRITQQGKPAELMSFVPEDWYDLATVSWDRSRL